MTVRTLFLHLRRRITITPTAAAAAAAPTTVTKHLCSKPDSIRRDSVHHDGVSQTQDDPLRSRILQLQLPNRSATNVIQNWVNEGNPVTLPQLRLITDDLRKSHRYKHALEITKWVVSHDEYKLSHADYAAHINLISKVYGNDAAERYFESLPQAAQTNATYTALLRSNAGSKLTDKAEDLLLILIPAALLLGTSYIIYRKFGKRLVEVTGSDSLEEEHREATTGKSLSAVD